jgi:hypothetical protein
MNDNFSAILALFGLALSFLTGGQAALWLDKIPQWKAWDSPFKAYAAFILIGVVGAALVVLQNAEALPQFFAGLPPAVQIGLVWLANYFGSQFTHKLDKVASPAALNGHRE